MTTHAHRRLAAVLLVLVGLTLAPPPVSANIQDCAWSNAIFCQDIDDMGGWGYLAGLLASIRFGF